MSAFVVHRLPLHVREHSGGVYSDTAVILINHSEIVMLLLVRSDNVLLKNSSCSGHTDVIAILET